MKPVIALVTARAARSLDEDLAPLEAALSGAGARVAIADWDGPGVNWSAFDAAILRSTWDYTQRLDEFLTWVAHASTLTQVWNSAAVVRWNTDKHYLSDLARAGVPTVPSMFVEPGMQADAAFAVFSSKHETCELVVKPAVGAGSRDAERYKLDARDAAIAHTQRLLDAGHSVVLQPYLDRVEKSGETALVFFSGRFSHAIRKGPMLANRRRDVDADAAAGTAADVAIAIAAGTAIAAGATSAATAINDLFVPEQIVARTAAADELRVAAKALTAIPFPAPLYARVDLLRDAVGDPVLLELELTEPSLFFAHAQGSATRFAHVVMQHVTPRGPRR